MSIRDLIGLITRPAEQSFPTALRGVVVKEKGGSPEDARQGNNLMLNILEMPPKAQGIASFVREGFTVFSAVQANQVLREAAYDGQRKISASHVAVLADIMKRGGWEQKDKIDFALFDGELILINGYHRMNAQVASGKSVLWTVVIHECQSLEQVRSLYYKFDTNTKIRASAQILNGIGFAEEHGLSKTIAQSLYNAVPIIAAGFSKAVKDRDVLTTRSTDRRLEMAKEYVTAAKMYEACLGRIPVKLSSKLRNGGLTAVALVTLRYQPGLAQEFWSGVAQNDGLSKGDPRLALHNDLIARSMNTGSQIQSVFAPAYAWNAWFNDKPIKIIKVYATSKASIDGTPFEA